MVGSFPEGGFDGPGGQSGYPDLTGVFGTRSCPGAEMDGTGVGEGDPRPGLPDVIHAVRTVRHTVFRLVHIWSGVVVRTRFGVESLFWS